jgi:hypothetical protein
METISSGIFEVVDKEVITIDVRKTGAQTLFGVNHTAFSSKGPLTEGDSLQVTMKKDEVTEDSTEVLNAKVTTITLVFSFNSQKDGRYDWTMKGSKGGAPVEGFSRQAGSTPKAITFTFHIV